MCEKGLPVPLCVCSAAGVRTETVLIDWCRSVRRVRVCYKSSLLAQKDKRLDLRARARVKMSERDAGGPNEQTDSDETGLWIGHGTRRTCYF